MRAKITLGHGGATSLRIRVDLIKQRRAVREVEQSRECKERPSPSVQVVVILFLAIAASKTKGVIARCLSQDFVHFIGVFRENPWRSFRPRRSELDSTGKRQVFNLDSGQTKVCLARRLDFIKAKARRIDAQFI